MNKNAQNTPPSTEIRPLEKDFTCLGWSFYQLKRDGSVALYLKTKPSWDRQTTVESWEVVLIRTRPKHPQSKDPRPYLEIYPPSVDWGKQAWTCLTHDRAMELYKSKLADT